MSIVGALPFTLQNGTTADATQVMADFNSIKTDVNSNAAANGANNDITSLAGLTTPLSVAQGGSGSAAPAPFTFTGGYRNIARRNGGLEIWQRGAGGAASFAVGASTTAYTADGWYLMTNANQACVVSQQAGIADGSQWCAKVLRNSGQTGTNAIQFGFPLDTDELYPMLGQYVRLSFTAKAGANWSPGGGNLTASVNVGTGTPVKFSVGYTGATVAAQTINAITTSAARYQVTSSAVIPTTTRQAEITFAWTPVGTAGVDDSVYIDDVQLEIVPAATGYVASNFERLIFEEQLLLCQAHFAKTFPYSVAPAQAVTRNNAEFSFTQVTAAAAAQSGMAWRFPVLLRKTAATVTTYNPVSSNAQAYNFTVAADCASLTQLSTIQREQFLFINTNAAGSAAGNLNAVHITADAGI